MFHFPVSRGTHGPWWWGKLQMWGNCSPGMRCAWLSRFGRTDVPSSYLLSISFHHTLLTTLYQKCVDIIPSHLDPKIVPELPRCGSAFLSGKASFFFLFYHDATLTAWEHSCLDHRLLTKVLCAPFSCSSHSPQIPRSPAKNKRFCLSPFFIFHLGSREEIYEGRKTFGVRFPNPARQIRPVDTAVCDCRGWVLFYNCLLFS